MTKQFNIARQQRGAITAAQAGLIVVLLLVIAGGVAANKHIFSKLAARAGSAGFRLSVPPAHLCTDNAAMIAWAALERQGAPDPLDFAPRPRWPLDPEAAPPPGRGVRS